MPSQTVATPPVPHIAVLTEGAIARVHAQALDVLERTGIMLQYPAALDLLARNGASVDPTQPIARVPRALVEQALASAPRQVSVYGQADPRRDCHLRLDGPAFARTTTGLNWIVDADSRRRRAVTAADVVNWTRIIQALPHLNLAGSLNDQEEAAKSEEVRCLARMLPFTDKPLMYSTFSGEGMRWLARLTEVTQATDRHPRLMVLSSVNSPLVYGWGQCEGAMTAAELGIPVCVNSSAVAGATAPVTLAGAVVQIAAEMLAALTLLQLHRPGAPVVWAAHPMAMDMRTGNASISTTEVGLMSAACVQLGRSYGLPTASNGLCSDACTPDLMATLEKWSCGYLPALAGANVNGGAGSLACVGTVSLEQLVIDDDLYGHLFRQLQGFAVDEGTLGGEVIHAVGPGSSFLMEDHTLAYFRTEHYRSPLANRLNAPTWEAQGSRDALDRAASQVRDLLAAPAEPLLSDTQLRDIASLEQQAESALARLEVRA